MLAHPLVNYSTILPGIADARHGRGCNRWLQCRPMRIELPPASWADAAHRADDDAHTLTLVAMGMQLLDNQNLEELAEACASRRRWEFQLIVAPLRLERGTASAVNPIAVF